MSTPGPSPAPELAPEPAAPAAAPATAPLAKQLTDAQFGSLVQTAALTQPQIHEHQSFNYTAGTNLLDRTDEVMIPAIPLAKGGDTAMRIAVEGADSSGAPWPDFTADFVPDYSAGSYASYLAHAENIRGALGAAGGENAVRAAFFQVHVELIGLTPTGTAAAAPANADDSVEVPAGIATLAAFSVATGVPEAELRQANSSLTGTTVTPGTRLVAPGCRYHTVAAASGPAGTGPRPRAQTTVAESKDQIATQNGVTTAALELANPNANWSALAAGDRILLPRH